MYITVDIGGTKTLLAVFDDLGTIIEQTKFPTPVEYDEFLQEMAVNVDKLSTKEFSYGCVALPGKVDRALGIGVVCGNLPWRNVPVQSDLEKLLHCPMLIENDANLAGLSEALLLKETYSRSLYITVSTGIGSGFVVNGTLLPATIDAEIGHMSLEHNGEFERWEKFASGKAIVAKYGKRASELEDVEAWKVIARNLAKGFITVIASLTPEVIIIGGGVGSHLQKFKDFLEAELQQMESPLLTIPIIVSAQRPEEAVVYGCYDLIKAHREQTHS